MSQIPEDVMQRARKAAAELGVYSDGLHTDVIARAILSDRASRSIAETGERETTPQQHVSLPQDVVDLVVAARAALQYLYGLDGCELRALDHAVDAFSERVPYDDEPVATTEGKQ